MSTNRFRIRVGLSDRSVADGSPIERYPDISDVERDRLPWAISGEFCVTFDGEPLTITPGGSPGCIDEYVWKQLIGLHSKMADLVGGKPVEQPILDNPGRTRFVPANGQVDVSFEHPRQGKNSSPHVTVPPREVLTALDGATAELVEYLVDANAELERSYLVTELVEANEDLEVVGERL